MSINAKKRIGIIGANPVRGWASTAHIPVLNTLPGYSISALSSKRPEDAPKLKNSFPGAHIYSTIAELSQSPEVDMVLVAIKVQHHFEAIKEVILAGKDVFSEWPLGKNLMEAEQMAALAKSAGINGYIGLQSRSVPGVRFIKDYIQAGKIGEVLSTTMIGSGIIYGEFTQQGLEYVQDPANGAGMLNVAFANAADALTFVLGEFTELSATTATRRKTTKIVETGQEIPVRTPDQVAVSGILESGAVATIHYRGGHFPGTNFLWEINGSEGDIQISASGGSLAVFELEIKASSGPDRELATLEIPVEYNQVADRSLDRIPTNVGQNYQLILDGKAPTFADAIIRHRMIDAIEQSAHTGTKKSYRITSVL